MIIIRLKGGLGNQMFQYALGRILAAKLNSDLKIDKRFFQLSASDKNVTTRNFELDIFQNNYLDATGKELRTFERLSIFNKLKRKFGLSFPNKFHEQANIFNPNIFDTSLPVYLNGYFQSYKYFHGYENLVKTCFNFKEDLLDKRNKYLLEEIRMNKYIGIHVRRGDYVNNSSVNSTLGVCSVDYYYKALDYLLQKYPSHRPMFFSDDPKWIKNTFRDNFMNNVVVDFNKGSSSWKDMFLMSQCEHQVIANSTFSWWAAWLNSNPGKSVVAPMKWYLSKNRTSKDLIPQEWIQL